MNQKEAVLYRSMIRYVRRLNIECGGGWPGKSVNDPAITRYPNILAEITARSGYLWNPANHAGVSEAVLAAVLEDGEELALGEMIGLCRLYACCFSYLSAPVLQMVDPATNKGRYRLRQLSDLLAQVNSLEANHLWEIKSTQDALEHGNPVTYAAWRCGVQES